MQSLFYLYIPAEPTSPYAPLPFPCVLPCLHPRHPRSLKLSPSSHCCTLTAQQGLRCGSDLRVHSVPIKLKNESPPHHRPRLMISQPGFHSGPLVHSSRLGAHCQPRMTVLSFLPHGNHQPHLTQRSLALCKPEATLLPASVSWCPCLMEAKWKESVDFNSTCTCLSSRYMKDAVPTERAVKQGSQAGWLPCSISGEW